MNVNQKNQVSTNLNSKTLKQEGVEIMNTENQKNQAVTLTENSNQEGMSKMNNNNSKKFKIHNETAEKVELYCHFIDDREQIFGDYIWVPKTAIKDNGLDETIKKDIEKDVAFERKREYVQLFYIDEVREDDDDDDDNLTFFIFG